MVVSHHHELNYSIDSWCGMFSVAMGRSLFIFNDVTFKMAAWQPYWILWIPDSNLSLALDIESKLHWHIIGVYRKKPIGFQQMSLSKWPPGGHIGFFGIHLDSVGGIVSGA